MIWDSMKNQLKLDDDLAISKTITQMITGIEMPEPPPSVSKQERQEFIELAKQLLWDFTKKSCQAHQHV